MSRVKLFVVLLLLSTAGLPAQQQQPPTFRSRTELIIVDAVVVDKDGNAVRGLKAENFALTDRKKPQRIETFEEVSHQRPAGPTAAAEMLPPTLKLDVASNISAQADRLVMVIIDDLHIWQGRTDKAKALANDIVAKLGPQASMAILFSSQEGSTQVTQDRSVLLAAINGMKARQTFRRPHQGFLQQGHGPLSGASAEAALDAINKSGRASLQDLQENLQYFDTLAGTAKMLLAEDRRRKAFVVITEGMHADFSSLGDDGSMLSDMGAPESNLQASAGTPAMRQVMDALRRANVAFYAIDPRGKVRPEDIMLESWPPPDCDVCKNPPATPQGQGRVESAEDSQFRWHNPVRMAQDGLGFMSGAAGGFAVTDTDDLTGGLSRVLEDLDHYYLLGFYPTDTGGGSGTHPVKLTLPGYPEYTIRFRRGYTPEPPSAPLKSKDPLAELANGVMPKSDLPLRLTAMPLPSRDRMTSVSIAIEVTAPVGAMKESDSKLRDDVQYSLLVVDDKKARVTQREGRSARFSLRADDPNRPTPDSVTYQIPLMIDLAPGRYQLRASAMSRKLDKGGSVYLDITVPDFWRTPLSLTTIALGYADGARVPVGRTTARDLYGRGGPAATLPPAQERAQNAMNPLPFEPTLSREFATTDALRTYFEVVRQNSRSTVALEIRVVDPSGATRLRYDRIVAPGDNGRIELRIPLTSLSSGAFTIHVKAGDSQNLATAVTGFIVK